LLLARDPQSAAPKLERAVALCPDRPDAPRLRLAQFLAERGRTGEAEPHFEALLRADPNHPPALLGLARVRQSQGRLAESTNLLARCLTDPHAAKSAHVLLAMLQQAQGNAASAAATARRAAALPADRPWPDPWWHEALAYRVGRKASLEDAAVLMDQAQFAEALNILAPLTRNERGDDEAWYLTGWALNQQQRFAEAEQALREHLRLSPPSPKGHAQLAVALLGQQRYEAAVTVLQAALKLKPTWRELHSNLGFASVQLGRDEEAIRHFRDALAHDPNYVTTYTSLADLLARRGQRDEARRLLRQALELNPADLRATALLERMGNKP
jgi:tetratricopeptide (TPR) repeat protein